MNTELLPQIGTTDESGFDVKKFTVYWFLKQADVKSPKTVAGEIESILEYLGCDHVASYTR